jgi:NADH:ubiquinone reductase (H+-translocating)
MTVRTSRPGPVLLVDRSDVVGDQLGPGPREEIETALDELSIESRLGTTVTEVGDWYAVLADGSRVERMWWSGPWE